MKDPAEWSVGFESPFRRVCLTPRNDGASVTGIQRCWNILYRLGPVLATCEYDRINMPRKPCIRDIFPVDPDKSPEVKVAVGQTLVTNVYFDLLTKG